MAFDLTTKLSALRQLSNMRMTELLDSISGSKDLIIDGSVMKPLERFIGVKVLKCHGVEKIFKLDKKEVSSTSNNLIFLIRANLITVKRVCDQINSTSSSQNVHLIVFPCVFHSIHVLLEEEGLYGRVSVNSFHWELISLDTRLFSFESPEVFKTSFVAKDGTYTKSCAQTLWSLQHVVGKPRFKICIGPYAKAIHSTMAFLDDNMGEPDGTEVSEVGLLLIVDRSLDYVSTLLKPGTYTSLLSDVIGVNCGIVQVPQQDAKGGPVPMLLTSEDETYNQIRHKHFSDVVPYLKHKINQFYTEQAKLKKMSVQEMRIFVQNEVRGRADKAGNSANVKVLANHLHLCEKVTHKIGKIFEGLQTCQSNILAGESRRDVITFIEELITTSDDMHLVLRLICLLSACQNGLSIQESNSLKMQFLHAYGHEHILTFYNLEKMGLITISQAVDVPAKLASKVVQVVSMPRKSAFQLTAARLRLFPDQEEEYSLKNPQDLGYVFGGIYIPMMAQIVSSIVKKERPLRDLMKALPGEFADALVEGKAMDKTADVWPHSVWVYVVGGITHAEVAAFDLLERKTGCRIICSGSSIIDGNALIDSLANT